MAEGLVQVREDFHALLEVAFTCDDRVK